MTKPPPISTLFPYTTLFRSAPSEPQARADERNQNQLLLNTNSRSEEHTSELQSRENLVCRLLLEKKKQLCGPMRLPAWTVPTSDLTMAKPSHATNRNAWRMR